MKSFGLIFLSLLILGAIVHYLVLSGRYLKVKEVVDGDTIRLTNGETIRLLGIDTPETHDKRTSVQFYGLKASEFLKKLALKQEVSLQFEATRRDKYQRLLAYVTLSQSGICLNEEMIRQGYGFVYTRFPFREMDHYRQLQKEALRAGRGLWAVAWRDSLKTIERKQDLIRNALQDAAGMGASPPNLTGSSAAGNRTDHTGYTNQAAHPTKVTRTSKIQKSYVAVPAPDGIAYIANKNSKVLHRWNCASVKKMKDKNKIPFSSSEQALKEGYKPCPKCMKP